MQKSRFPYQKYEGLIKSIARRYSRAYGKEFDDMVGCGHIGYMKALQSFDECRGCKFSTHLVNKVKGEIHKTLQPRAGTLAPEMKAELSDRLQDDTVDMERQSNFLAAMRGMGAEAREVVELIFESPVELFDWTAGVVKITVQNLREYLRNNGWTVSKADKAFMEIRQILRTM